MAIAFIAGYSASSKTLVSRKPNVLNSVSESGILRFVNMGAQTYYNITAVFEQLTEAQKETMVDWLVTNELAEIDLTVGSETYRGYVDMNKPASQRVSPKTGHLWDVTFFFMGVKQ